MSKQEKKQTKMEPEERDNKGQNKIWRKNRRNGRSVTE
jgi:hypothetical protein